RRGHAWGAAPRSATPNHDRRPAALPSGQRHGGPPATSQTQSLSSAPGKGSGPQAPAGRSLVQARARRASRLDSGPQQPYGVSTASSRPKPALGEKTPEGPQQEAPRPPEAEAPRGQGARARLRPGPPSAEASPGPEELSFQKCFQETPSSFTSTNYTSPSATPGPPPLRAPQSSGASPCRPASYVEFQASRADAWPPTAENSFPGASFGALPAEPEPFPEGGSPGVVAFFQYPFPELHGAGPKPFPEDAAGPDLAAFLGHRQFCSLLPARAKDGHQQPPGPAAAPFPLPAGDLDLEDAAKLDSLITEALNGLEYQSDTPEIDSSFIDDCDGASESEEEDGPRLRGSRFRGRPRPSGRRWRRGEKRKEVDLAPGPREGGQQQKPRKAVRQEAVRPGGSPGPEEPGGPWPGPVKGPEAQGPSHGPEAGVGPEQRGPQRLLQGLTGAETPEESHPSLDCPQDTESPETAEDLPPDAAGLHREALSSPPATCGGGGPCPPAPERPQLRQEDAVLARASSPALGAPRRSEPATPGLGDSVGLPTAKKGPQPYSSPPSGLFLGPKDLAGCCHEDLGSQSSAPDSPPAIRAGLCQDGEDASSQEPRPPRNTPYTVVTDPGKAESPPALERTALFSGPPGDSFHPPVCGSLSGNGDTQVPRACAAPPPRRPQQDPPFLSFLPKKGWSLLEEVSPVPPGHLGPFPGLSGEKAFSQRCPSEGTVATSLPALPGKVIECSTACSGDLSEEELEIKRLVTELESQLQSKGAQEAPGEPCAASATSPGELRPRPEGAETTVATTGGALGSPQEEWPSFHPGEAALAPGAHKDVVPGGPFSPTGASLSFRPVQKAGVSKTGLPRAEGGLGAHLEVCLPDPPWDMGSLAKGGLSPGSHKAPGPCRDPSELEAFGSPVAPPAPGLAFRGAELLPLGATPHSGASHNSAPKGHSVSSTGGPGGAGGPGPEGNEEFVPAGASPHRASVPDRSPGRRPEDPASSPLHQLQLLVARAAEREDDTRGSQGPPPGDTQRPQHSDPSDPGRESVEGGKTACSPARDFPGAVQATAVPARSRAAVGLWNGARATPGPTYSEAESSVPALAATDTEDGPEDQTPEAVAGPGLQKHLLFAGESPAPPARDLASRTPSPASAAPPDPCGPKEGPARRPLRGDCGPLEDPPKEPSFVAATALSSIPTTGGLGAVRGPRAEWPDPRGALSSTHPDGVPKGPSSEPPGNRESQGVTAVPTDPSTRGAMGPDPHTCQEGEAEASLQEQEGLEMPRAGRPAITEASEAGTRGLRVTCPSTELHPGRTTTPSSTASDSRLHSPQSLGNSLHQRPQGDPVSPQDPRQKPRGFKKKPVFTENGHWRGGAPSGQPVTCEVCAASFRSGPGLSRHRARKHGLHREPRKQDQLERDEPRSKQTKKAGGQRRGRPPADFPSESEGKASKRARKPRARRFREESGLQGPADVISGRRGWNPSTAIANCPALPSRHLSPEAEQETGSTQPPLVATDLEETPARKSPGDRVACPGMAEGAPPAPEGPVGRKAASARGCAGPRETRMSGIRKEPSRAAGGKRAGDSRVAESRSGQGVWEGHERPWDPQGPPETRGSEAGSTISSCLQDPLHSPGEGVQEQEGTAPEAPSPNLRDPLSLFDDEASFSQLFPLGDRLVRKKNPRVYGKRCKKSKPPPRPEPSSQAGGSVALSSSRLPTDLSDSGSLCLSHEDLWGDEAAGLPESFLLEGFLSSKVPGIDPWATGPSLWALEPHAEADPCCAEDHPSENIPELHMMQGLCFLGPCEDPAGLPGASLLDFKATASSQGPQSRTEGAAGARRAPGGGRPTKARRAPYKCRVCFQRFHGLGELDLHKLAHSPSPPPTCYMCVERRFGSRELLREHLQEKHVQSKAGLWACGMCRREVADVWMYNEHLREHAVRFARKGQARSGIAGQVSKPHRGKRSIGKAGGGPAEASGADVGAGKVFPRERPRPKARANGSDPDSASAQGSPSACGLSPDGRSHSESPLPAVPVHQDCKDPARDCHHCGKRFPKPFKLQRHLAVHSPQRVYLCPQCPRVYPEHQELRVHLGGEHGLSGELELQHTPLYACELCANVTHISKRSFVCSSCNYTFAKKEQFDRHMDKHRRRGQQPFTFRGPCPEAAPGTPERPTGPVGHPVGGGDLPSALQELLPPSLSPFPAASADGKDGHEPDQALESSEDEASPGSPGRFLQQALPLGGSLPQPGAGGQDAEEKRAAGPLSGKHRTPSAPGKCAPDHHPEAPSLLWKEKQVSTCHVAPAGGAGGPSHRGSANKPGGCQSSSKDRSASSTPSKAPKFPVQMKKAVPSPMPRELPHGTEDRPKPTTLKVKPGPGSQGAGGPRQGTKAAGGSQPQPASGQLQSETATTPAKPDGPGQGPAPDKAPHRAPAKGYPKGPREAGRGPPVPDKPPRAPRKQATPSRVLPAKPKPSGQNGTTPPQPSEPRKGEPGHAQGNIRRGKEGLGKALPQARPLHRPPRRGGAVLGAEPPNPRACRTAESQSHLLSQLFGQRLTSFKIPLKKDASE
ncbi:hypothetical protein E2I00_019641, partial [Balaenoptera physalus]